MILNYIISLVSYSPYLLKSISHSLHQIFLFPPPQEKKLFSNFIPNQKKKKIHINSDPKQPTQLYKTAFTAALPPLKLGPPKQTSDWECPNAALPRSHPWSLALGDWSKSLSCRFWGWSKVDGVQVTPTIFPMTPDPKTHTFSQKGDTIFFKREKWSSNHQCSGHMFVFRGV